MCLVMRKPAFCKCENKDADQLRGDLEADQRLRFQYTDSTTPPLLKYENSKPPAIFCGCTQPHLYPTWSEVQRPVFSQRGSYCLPDMRFFPIKGKFAINDRYG